MKQSVYKNLVGWVDFDPAGPTTIARGIVASVTVGGAGNYTVNLDPNNALDPTQSDLAASLKGGAADGWYLLNHASDVAISVATGTGIAAADRRFQLAIYDLGPA